jgi:hypothetical protein
VIPSTPTPPGWVGGNGVGLPKTPRPERACVVRAGDCDKIEPSGARFEIEPNGQSPGGVVPRKNRQTDDWGVA